MGTDDGHHISSFTDEDDDDEAAMDYAMTNGLGGGVCD